MKYLIILLYIFAIINTVVNKKEFFILPFKKEIKINKEMSHSEIINNLENIDLIVDVKIGTPSQNIKLKIKTDTQFTYILSNETGYPIETEKKIKLFHPDDSQTYEIFAEGIHQIEKYDYSYYIQESFYINNIFLEKFMYIAPFFKTKVEYMPDIAGIIGLGNTNIYEEQYFSNFIQNLKSDDYVYSYDYFIKYDNEDNGRIIIGVEPYEYNSKYKRTNCNTKYPLNDKFNFETGFYIDRIMYNDKLIKSNYKYAIIKVDYGFIMAGKDIYNLLYENNFKQFIDKNICYINQNQFITIYCKKEIDKSKFGQLNIFNKDFNTPFIIQFSKLFYDYGDYTYFLMKFSNDNTKIILGEYFLKNNLLVFNQDRKFIKMFLPYTPKQNKSIILAVVLIILCVVVIVIIGILLYVYSNKLKNVFKKKRGTELISCDDGD